MGLDMYLTAERFVGGYSESELRDKFLEFINEHLVSSTVPTTEYGSCEVLVEVAYWRKANAIHRWFVDNCQEGVDDCRRAYVDVNDLKELVELCDKALVNKDIDDDTALEFLPPTDGFFFGSTIVDEYYWEQVKETSTQLKKVIDWIEEEESKKNYWSLYYQSSW